MVIDSMTSRSEDSGVKFALGTNSLCNLGFVFGSCQARTRRSVPSNDTRVREDRETVDLFHHHLSSHISCLDGVSVFRQPLK